MLSPIRALKSPHINLVSWGCTVSNTVSSSVVACISGIFLLVRDVVGGMYTFTILIL